jgi:hypothetical protein
VSTSIAPLEDRSLYHIVDDLSAYTETLEMLDAQLRESLPDDERAEIEKARAEVRASLEIIGKDLATKTDAVAVVLRRLAHERDYIHEERGRLKAKESASERAEKWLRDYVVSVMQQGGVKQLKTAHNTLFLRGTDAVEITDVTQIPATYMNAEVKLPLWMWRQLVALAKQDGGADFDAVRVHTEPSLSTIKKAIKSGVDVAGADLKLNTSLVCR